MTAQSEVIKDPNYKAVLNHGFVGLVDHMGSDSSIVQAARVSYGAGTKKVSEDKGLIRYLLRHKHTTPFEMVTLKFHCKMPIFVARQWIRHRTASVNEYSARYSIMSDEFYIPDTDVIQPQSTDNKQGRSGDLSFRNKKEVQVQLQASAEDCYHRYQTLLGEGDTTMFFDDFDGIAREMARGVLSVNNYTEWYWSINLHNLLHFLQLRMDSHAQYEIRVFAEEMYEIIKKICPVACEAFEDYKLYAVQFSRMEMNLLRDLLDDVEGDVEGDTAWERLANKVASEKELCNAYEISPRELREFKEKLDLK